MKKKSSMKWRKTALIALAAIAGGISAKAQTLNVVTGEITYAFPAAQTGDMTYQNGTTLTICGKTFSISDIDSIYIDKSAVEDGTVSIGWNGASAKVRIAGNVARYLDATATGADITLLQTDDLADEITYTLSGTSTDGSLYMDGELKATFVLNGLNLANTDDYAIFIKDGKRIAIELADGTDNYLADGTTSTSGKGKGALMVNGHTEFDGAGTLTLTGNYKHAFWGDEYVKVKKGTGTITVASSVKDGFNINQYFQQNDGKIVIKNVGDDGIQVSKDGKTEYDGQMLLYGGSQEINVTATAAKGLNAEGKIIIGKAVGETGGTYTISTTGGGEWDSDASETKACSAIKSDADIIINAGTIVATSTGAGGKGINASDSTLTINGGNITVKTTGARYTYGNGRSDNYKSSPKGIKAALDIVINGGNIDVSTTGGEGSEGIESKGELTINGGTLNIYSYDDAINCAKNLYIKGGDVTVVSGNNDGLDANNNIYISGGTVKAFGSRAPECAIDAAEGYEIIFTGGTILGVGGSSSTPTSSSSTQPYVNFSGSVSAGNTISISNGSTTLASFTVPDTYSSSSNYGGGGPGGHGGGPGGGGSYIMISTPDMQTNSSYTINYGSSSTTSTAEQYGGGGWW